MPKFEEGDPVYYIPDHADGPGHQDAEVGVVKEAGPPVQPHRDRKYLVDYDDPSPVAKTTYERHLIKREVNSDE